MLGEVNYDGEYNAGSVYCAFWYLNGVLRLLVEVANETSSLLDSTVFFLLGHMLGTKGEYLNEAQNWF